MTNNVCIEDTNYEELTIVTNKLIVKVTQSTA